MKRVVAKAEPEAPKRKGNPAFRKGVAQPGAGRPKGSVNKTSVLVKEAMLTAMEMVGNNNRGKDGAAGYMAHLAWKKPEIFGRLLEKLLPFQLTGAGGGPVQMEYRSNEEIVQRFKERGLPVPKNLMLPPPSALNRPPRDDEEEEMVPAQAAE